jgi:hypothetical protein
MLFRQAAIAGGVAQARSSPRRRRHRFSAAMEQKGSLKGPKTIAELPDGSLADIRQSPSYVRFTPESGHRHRWHLRVHALTTVPRYGRRARNTTARC